MKRLTDVIRYRKDLLLLLYIPFYLLWFFLVERMIPSSSTYYVSYLPIDDSIPFLEGFVVFYVLWYPFLALPGLLALFKDDRAYRHYLIYLIIGFSICLLIFSVFPNGQNLRPAVMERNNLCTKLVEALYRVDTNTNVLPSMHVVGCIGTAALFFDMPLLRRFRWPAVVLALLICASTVFIKQHSLLDCLWGLAVGAVACWFAYVLPAVKNRRKKESQH